MFDPGKSMVQVSIGISANPPRHEVIGQTRRKIIGLHCSETQWLWVLFRCEEIKGNIGKKFSDVRSRCNEIIAANIYISIDFPDPFIFCREPDVMKFYCRLVNIGIHVRKFMESTLSLNGFVWNSAAGDLESIERQLQIRFSHKNNMDLTSVFKFHLVTAIPEHLTRQLTMSKACRWGPAGGSYKTCHIGDDDSPMSWCQWKIGAICLFQLIPVRF